MMLGFIAGLTLGLLLINIAIEEERKKISALQEDLNNANSKIKYRDDFVRQYQEEHKILLEDVSKLKAEIIDLENNLELVTNNLSEGNKKLIPDFDSQN